MEIAGIGTLGPQALHSLNNLVQLVASCMDLPQVAIWLAQGDKLTAIARRGIEIETLPLDKTISKHTLQAGAPLAIADTTADIRTRDNQHMREGVKLRSYIGCPIEVDDEQFVGVFAAGDIAPREFAGQDLKDLERFSQLASAIFTRTALKHEVAEHRKKADALQAANERADKALQEAEAARRNAESASRAKTRFLAIVSHETRTPLHGILGSISELRYLCNGCCQEVFEFLAMAEKCGNELLATIDQILEVSSGESPGICVQREAFSITKCVEDIYDLCAPLAAERGLRFDCDTKLGQIDRLLGDPQCLRRILVNLVVNAIKYTEKGRISLVLEHHPDPEERPRHVLIVAKVKDTGIGIAPEDLERIFWPFEQTGDFNTRRESGVGLGLSIAREMTQCLGGDLAVSSEPEKGSVFTLSVPFVIHSGEAEKARPAAPRKGAPDMATKALPNLKVLLVDDQETMLILGQKMLGRQGIAPDIARNGLEAVELVKKGYDYDLVLTDLRMPIMDGLDASRNIRKIHAETGRPAPKIVAVTAHEVKDTQAKCRKVGIDSIYSKPFRMRDLEEVLEEVKCAKMP